MAQSGFEYLQILVALVVQIGVLGWGRAVARHHARVPGTRLQGVAGAHELDPEVPLVAEVEQEEELLAGRDLTDAETLRPFRALAAERVRLGVQGVLGRRIPRLATQEEGLQVRIVEGERLGDRLAQVGEGLGAGELDLAPDLRRVGWGAPTAEDADAEGVRRGLESATGAGHRAACPMIRMTRKPMIFGMAPNSTAKPDASEVIRASPQFVIGVVGICCSFQDPLRPEVTTATSLGDSVTPTLGGPAPG